MRKIAAEVTGDFYCQREDTDHLKCQRPCEECWRERSTMTIREAVIAAIKDGEACEYFSDGYRYDAWKSHLPEDVALIHHLNEQAAAISPDNKNDFYRMRACLHPEQWVARHYQEGLTGE